MHERRSPMARTPKARPADARRDAPAAAAAAMPAATAADPAEAFGATVGTFVQSLAGLGVPASTVLKLQQDYVAEAAQLWNRAVEQLPLVHGLTATRPDPVANAGGPQKSHGDRRFAGPDWTQSPAASWTAQMYLLNS